MALLRRDDRVERILLEFREEFRDWRAELRAEREENRSFMREMILRSEKLHRESMAISRDISRKTDQILIDGEASRNALFTILDRLDGLDPPAADA